MEKSLSVRQFFWFYSVKRVYAAFKFNFLQYQYSPTGQCAARPRRVRIPLVHCECTSIDVSPFYSEHDSILLLPSEIYRFHDLHLPSMLLKMERVKDSNRFKFIPTDIFGITVKTFIVNLAKCRVIKLRLWRQKPFQSSYRKKSSIWLLHLHHIQSQCPNMSCLLYPLPDTENIGNITQQHAPS